MAKKKRTKSKAHEGIETSTEESTEEPGVLKTEVVQLRNIADCARKFCRWHDQQGHGQDPSGYIGLMKEALKEEK